MAKTATIILYTCVLLGGCNAPLPDRNLQEYVTQADVVGTWKLTRDSLELLVRDGFKRGDDQTNEIAFQNDGSLTFQSVLDEFRGGTYHEVSGKWTLERDTLGNSNVRKKNAIRMDMSLPTTTYCMYLNFDCRGGRLILWSFYGDPDSWEFMEYEKASN